MLKCIYFHSYKVITTPELNDYDTINRLEFFRIMRDNHRDNENNLFMRDEAHAYINTDVNKQNFRF